MRSRNNQQCLASLPPPPHPPFPSPGRYIENHGVVHNMWFNTTSGIKKPYYQTQFVDEWWDNGTVPIWITAQRQVGPSVCPSASHCSQASAE